MKNAKEKIINKFFEEAGHCISTRTPGNFGAIREALSKVIDELNNEWEEKSMKERYWTACPGCAGGHPSFWKTIVESKHWKQWYEYASKYQLYDVDECQECGWIGERHFNEFIDYIVKRRIILRDAEWANTVEKSKIKKGWFDMGKVKESYNAVLDDIIKIMKK